jgi:hypothetical protein
VGFLKRLRGQAEPEPEPVEEEDLEYLDLRGAPPADRVKIDFGPAVPIVGESYYQANLLPIGGSLLPGQVALVWAELVAQPENRHDPIAIAVVIDGRVCGHLARADAIRYGPVVARAVELGRIPVARGWVRRARDTATPLSAGLRIVGPNEALAALTTPEPSDRPYSTTACPYCSTVLDPLPKAKKACPSCGQPIYVRSAPDGLRHLLREADLPALEAAWQEYRADPR